MSESTDQPTDARPWWGSVLLSCVLFSLSYTTSCVQREQQRAEMHRQAEDLAEQRRAVQEIKALMAARKPTE